MIRILRTTSENHDFAGLVRELDAYLKIKDGGEHSFYDQYNKIDNIKFALVAYREKIPLGIGAIKKYSPDEMEVKRMYVIPGMRNKGIASGILKELEQWAAELGFEKCILETGKRQTEAVALYTKCGYTVIPNYGQYAGMDNSVCFEKILNK